MSQILSCDDGALLRLKLRAEPQSLIRLAKSIADLAEREGWDDALSFQLDLVIEELVQNAIAYGYPGGCAGEISVSIAWVDGALLVTIEDDGIPFDPLSLPEPDLEASISDRDIGGLGIHFARTYTDEQSYCREEGRNCVRLLKRIPLSSD